MLNKHGTRREQRSHRSLRRYRLMSRKYRRLGRRRAMLVMVTGVVLLVGSASILLSMWLYRHHAMSSASRLVEEVKARERAATNTRPQRISPMAAVAACSAPPPSSPAAGNGARMIIAASSVNLRAPVLPGVDDSQLDVGVGHLPTSAWPDQGGTSVLEAHDVTFFSRLGELRAGQIINVTAPCRQWTYRVTSGQVVRKGTPVANTPASRLVLVTCWPTNALYLTDYRYVVSADLISATNTAMSTTQPVARTVVPSAVLPAGLTRGQVSTDTVGVPEGTLTVTGSMDPASSASAEVLTATSNAFAVFDVALLSAEHRNPAWWLAETSPNSPLPPSAVSPLEGIRPRWREAVDVVLNGSGNTIQSADMTSVVDARNHRYQLHVHLDQIGGRFVLSQWQMAP